MGAVAGGVKVPFLWRLRICGFRLRGSDPAELRVCRWSARADSGRFPLHSAHRSKGEDFLLIDYTL